MYRIFIVEDDPGIAEGIKRQAEAWGLEVRCADDLRNVMGEFAAFSPHLVLLDITLPFFNGYHWCSAIRAVSKVPIIFISSAADSMNIVMAMSMGADDFIAKPFDGSVLMAKIQALLRRSYDFAPGMPIIEAQQRRIRHRQQRQPVKRKACKEYRRCKHRRRDKPRMLF